MRRSPAWFAAWIIAAGFAALAASSLTAPYRSLRENVWDWATSRNTAARSPGSVAVVDIDRATLLESGPWPWPRSKLASVVAAVASGGPKVIVIDIVLEGADERAPAGLARRLSILPPAAATALTGIELEDGDARLAAAPGAAVPVVLALALDSEREGARLPAVPVFSRGKPDLDRIWSARGAIGPGDALVRTAAGLGVSVLPGDEDGRTRRVPLLVKIAGRLHPGLAVEAVRVAGKASSYILSASPYELRLADAKVDLAADGMLRLRPTSAERHNVRTIPARDLLSGRTRAESLKDRIVLVGMSAPEAGGLRSAAFGRLVPSVQLQADAVEQILAGDSPRRPRLLALGEVLAALAACAGAALAGFRLAPLAGGAATAAVAAGWAAACVAAARWSGVLVDPLLPLGAALMAHPVSAFVAATELRRREQAIRQRFEQHLSPDVVRRLAEQPGLMRLEGEAREVTALFTDIEGFTDLTERCDPRTMVAMLDRYFEATARIVVEHGGMIEKFVGDALHVLFNAPLDLPDHPRQAMLCAQALVAFSERFRSEPQPKELGFGRTRVGIETGTVIVGDVGGGRRLDYTAHGRAMNMAARLEAANKELGSSICVGPVAAGRLDTLHLRPLGAIALKGFADKVEVKEPWPPGYDAEDRRAYTSALSELATSPEMARARLATLAAKHPRDGVIRSLLSRL